MATKPPKTPPEIVDAHKPKNVKYKFIFTDDSFLCSLEDTGYDISTTDTINNPELIEAAMSSVENEVSYEREVVARAKKPTYLDTGVVLSKQLITKADKKLQEVKVGYFTYQNCRYVRILFVYQAFMIIELFRLI